MKVASKSWLNRGIWASGLDAVLLSQQSFKDHVVPLERPNRSMSTDMYFNRSI